MTNYRATFDPHGYFTLHRRLGFILIAALSLIVGLLIGHTL